VRQTFFSRLSEPYRYCFYRCYKIMERWAKPLDDRPWFQTIVAFGAWVMLNVLSVLTIIEVAFGKGTSLTEEFPGAIVSVAFCVANYVLLVTRGRLESLLREFSSRPIPKSNVIIFNMFLFGTPLLFALVMFVVALSREDLPPGF